MRYSFHTKTRPWIWSVYQCFKTHRHILSCYSVVYNSTDSGFSRFPTPHSSSISRTQILLFPNIPHPRLNCVNQFSHYATIGGCFKKCALSCFPGHKFQGVHFMERSWWGTWSTLCISNEQTIPMSMVPGLLTWLCLGLTFNYTKTLRASLPSTDKSFSLILSKTFSELRISHHSHGTGSRTPHTGA